ncbi:O-antigen ligase family protein [Acinetobacter courvalinii]|uniref:O-antigen ligase family protein n=1 Tax=Acinetobacter courvalinii TaxID=280147 RepID=UPI0018FF4182|nr:O-antigen ligase family protein [Acinetobacter courvalinii]MBJ8418073.1 O-antigen ligase family protein [Acinetobacter courvalinii]
MIFLVIFYLLLFSFGFRLGYLNNQYDELRLLQILLAFISVFFLIKNNFNFRIKTILFFFIIYFGIWISFLNFNIFKAQDVLMWLSIFFIFLSMLKIDFQGFKIQRYLSILVLGSVTPIFFIFLFIYDFLVSGDKNDWGVYYGSIRIFDSYIISIFWLTFFLLIKGDKIFEKIYVYIIFLIGVALFFNGARSALLSIIFPLLILWVIKIDYRSLVNRILKAFGVSFLLYNFIYIIRNLMHGNSLDINIARLSTSRRSEMWVFMYDKWKENPFIGLGGGFLAKEHYIHGYHAHNLWLRLIFEWGGVGVILLIFILNQIYILFNSKVDPVLKMGVLSIIIDATFSGSFVYPASQMSCILFLALAFSYIKQPDFISQNLISSKILILLYVFLFFYIILKFFWMDVSCFGCMSQEGRLAPFFWEYGGTSHLK